MKVSNEMKAHLFNQCFGDLPQEVQDRERFIIRRIEAIIEGGVK